MSIRPVTIILVVLALASGVACYDAEFPEAGVSNNSGPYTITLTLTPSHPHPGDVFTFSFMVMLDSDPVDGLSPESNYTQTSGGTAAGTISLSPGMDSGTYEGTRVWQSAGDYEVSFEFNDMEGTSYGETFFLFLESH